MYSTRTGLILAFHGCDASIVPDVLSGRASLRDSVNKYDWLGHGVYFWDNSPSRALEFATFLSQEPGRGNPIKSPAVLGAVLNLGFCLDLLDYQNLDILKKTHRLLATTYASLGQELPVNKKSSNSTDLLLRELDCAVVQALHHCRKQARMQPFDSVRGVFWEGNELYPDAGFREKDHIQLCIRNPNCVKGYFIPQHFDTGFSKV
ncbi:MAG: hypothetical protein P0Y53_23560 [Candidatus Pseudobacter hemicellulosilyticus]|uniref:Uncharacterized protein n=1 Tax=Candidatus Pseudobacter hemicellulosilyticus TaxID=3121375 RepID=A0AAJ6BFC0_9BACT|nr:MAG: hypothetical protein P0Y53_23560 [Pseudobacter sp.]